MGSPIRNAVAAAAARCGYFASRLTEATALREAAALLRPLDSGRELVRVGGAGDGGYLLPDDLDGIAACYSPGVAAQAAFEQELARRGIAIRMADASIPGPPPGCAGMSFERRFLGSHDVDPFTTLAAWVARHAEASAGDLLLQMDVEGAEYEVIVNVEPALLARFRILVVEFHDLDCLAQPFAHRLIRAALEKLAKAFVPVHLHPNNYAGIADVRGFPIPRMLEATFLRRDRCLRLEPRTDFPHPLDCDNVPGKPPAPLPRAWFA